MLFPITIVGLTIRLAAAAAFIRFTQSALFGVTLLAAASLAATATILTMVAVSGHGSERVKAPLLPHQPKAPRRQLELLILGTAFVIAFDVLMVSVTFYWHV